MLIALLTVLGVDLIVIVVLLAIAVGSSAYRLTAIGGARTGL